MTAASLLLALSAPATAASCNQARFDGVPLTHCVVDPSRDAVRLWLRADDGSPIGTFNRLEDVVRGDGERLTLAMNAGMYHADRSPVGLYIEDREQIASIVTREGPGNFGLLPNGVLCLTDQAASVIESREFAAAPPDCEYATQSGPMLVIDGELHPRFIPNGSSRNIRNGVGVDGEGRLHLVISDAPVNFHTFARFFRDVLNTPQALYMDGRISRLFASDIGRADGGFPMGPILGVVAD